MRNVTILERDPVVAEDIRETVAELWPDAQTSVVASMPEACADILTHPTGAGVAILHASRRELADPELLDALRARDTRVLAVHAPLDDTMFWGWVFLSTPFTTESLVETLQTLLAR